MKVNIYWVGFESELWDLPPGHERCEAIFLDKSQAIAYVKDEWATLERLSKYDMFTIYKQIETPDGITHKPVYKYNGTLVKIKN